MNRHDFEIEAHTRHFDNLVKQMSTEYTVMVLSRSNSLFNKKNQTTI